MMLTGIAWVAAGGALGSVARHLVTLGTHRFLGSGLPWNTLAVNVLGSFAMGLAVTWVASRPTSAPDLRLFLATGVLGGFTTFSAFSLDVVTLLERRELAAAALYASASMVLSLLAIVGGIALARSIWS
jgi:fluoride exporter